MLYLKVVIVRQSHLTLPHVHQIQCRISSALVVICIILVTLILWWVDQVILVLWRALSSQCSKFKRAGSGHLSGRGRRKSSTMFSTVPDYSSKNGNRSSGQRDRDPKISTSSKVMKHLSRLVGKPTMWFPNRSDTNQPVQSKKIARGSKFRI